MGKIFLIVLFMLSSTCIYAQNDGGGYKTVIYTDPGLSEDIQDQSQYNGVLSFGASEIISSASNAIKGIGAGYITSFVDMGVNAVASLLTRKSAHKTEWEKMIAEENTWSTEINSVEEAKDFYRKTSFDGALDPSGMYFNGIGCMRMVEKDTVFFISCHIDRSNISNIVNHSKFNLTLDTLILSPTNSRLPNTQLPIRYSLDERQNFNLAVNIKLYSSWFTSDIVLHKDVQLGEFNFNIKVNPDSLDSKEFIHYVRNEGEKPKYEITGESFVVPRSYMNYRTPNGTFKDIWGTGQYSIQITLSEKCDITDKLRHDWKKDRKKHIALKKKTNFIDNVWQTVTKQKWDELSKQWVITTLSAPASVISSDIIDKLGLDSGSQNSSMGVSSAVGGSANTVTSK